MRTPACAAPVPVSILWGGISTATDGSQLFTLAVGRRWRRQRDSVVTEKLNLRRLVFKSNYSLTVFIQYQINGSGVHSRWLLVAGEPCESREIDGVKRDSVKRSLRACEVTIIQGQQIHAQVYKLGFVSKLIIRTAVMQMYASFDEKVAWSQKEALWRPPQGMMHKTMTLADFDKGKQDGLHKETIDLGAQVEAENKKGDLLSKDD
ncbi:pentatricopeptide repeat-containing protein [Senna tora]|uniref:Pentatricopeptide repeat-containing protein n=1 Tax=Senna tora TaxID=362788 RepID=A0A834WVJ7_9FABA|nr:pentatricopeptide repeat-containing protein [Senna tora]